MDSTIRATHDVDALTMTFTCVLDAPVDRVWQLWADPRQSVDAPHTLVFKDGFADEHGEPDRTQPTMRMVVALEDVAGRTRMTDTAHFGSAEELERLLEMGMREGMLAALGQIDGILTA